MQIDWSDPAADYTRIFRERVEALNRLRANSSELPALRAFYRDHPERFIDDWGTTVNPKNVERGLPALVPFRLFPKQVEATQWIVDHWKVGRPALIEKSRQSGMSWLSIALACTLALFYPGLVIGFGSRKSELIDSLDNPAALFPKARTFLSNLPAEFRGGWDIDRHAPYMKIVIPETGSVITGESGDQIGRGASTSLFFVDEAAFLEHPELIERSLSQTTNCRVDISTPNGLGNSFATKRFSGKVDVLTISWRDDPRRSDRWYAEQVATLDPISVAQELDIDYAASAGDVVIPSAWVAACVDAHKKLLIEATGARWAALDIADEGRDMCAFAGCHGIVVEQVEQWSGKASDIYKTAAKAFALCDLHGYDRLRYDADGLGSAIRGDGARLNEERAQAKRSQIVLEAFRGSEAVLGPDSCDVPGRKNKDLFLNRKAQCWWALRRRFEFTHQVVVEGLRPIDPERLISISGKLKLLAKLLGELSQPTWSVTSSGKIQVDKAPGEGVRSPDLADAVMILFATIRRPPMRISSEALALAGQRVTA